MKIKYFTLLLLLLMLFISLNAAEKSNADIKQYCQKFRVVTLKNDKVELQIALNIGGRVISFRRVDGRNVLLFTPAGDHSEIPEPSPKRYFPMYNGHIIWVGPQKEWWAQQSVNKERLKRKASWPPDPYLCVGRYKIIKQTPVELVIKGPSSPVSGLTLTKCYQLQKDGSVKITVEAENSTKRILNWDLWSNTRMPQSSKVFVPVIKKDNKFVLKVVFNTKNPVEEKSLPSSVNNGFFTFTPKENLSQTQVSKAYINFQQGVIYAFYKNNIFIKKTNYPKKAIHPDQAFIEIYQKVSPDKKDGILELEFHSAFTQLRPGEKFEFTEYWNIIKYNENKKNNIETLIKMQSNR